MDVNLKLFNLVSWNKTNVSANCDKDQKLKMQLVIIIFNETYFAILLGKTIIWIDYFFDVIKSISF